MSGERSSYTSQSVQASFHRKSQPHCYYRSDYTLTLTPAGGAAERYSLVLEDPTPNAPALFINDDAFLKQDGR